MDRFNANQNFTASEVAGVSGFITEGEIILAHREIRRRDRSPFGLLEAAKIVIGFGCEQPRPYLPLPKDQFGREYFG